ncbi:MAG: 4-hydroxyphenylacetate 3-hydroxylase family protein [Candidatus Methanomethylicia archaeon]
MMNGNEYVESLRRLRKKVYMFGEEIKDITVHPFLKPTLNSIALTYQLAYDERYRDLLTATSHLTGRRINRFTHIPQNTDDLVKKVKMLRLLGQKTGSCFQRCVGMDALIALSSVTYEIDQKYGTDYYKRFIRFLIKVQDEDLMCGGSMTDVKGDRSLRPSQQKDPDMFVHVVEKRDDGIVIRGAKAHQSGSVFAHELVVMPTLSMRETDKDYAVSCAVPADADGVLYIVGRQTNDSRKMEECEIDVGNLQYSVAGHEALVVFDDVFVPWDRVFMCGEWDFSGVLVERFASYHRQNYGGCKVGVGDVLIGAAATIADYNGVSDASHIREKLVEMAYLNETMHACGLACSYEGVKLPSGTYYVNPLLANVTKLNVTKFPFEMARLAIDITGGIIGTQPSERDFKHPVIGKYIEKYLKARENIPTEYRMRIVRLIENMVTGTGLIESMHGAGSPQAQRIMIARQVDFELRKKLAKILAGIERDS